IPAGMGVAGAKTALEPLSWDSEPPVIERRSLLVAEWTACVPEVIWIVVVARGRHGVSRPVAGIRPALPIALAGPTDAGEDRPRFERLQEGSSCVCVSRRPRRRFAQDRRRLSGDMDRALPSWGSSRIERRP